MDLDEIDEAEEEALLKSDEETLKEFKNLLKELQGNQYVYDKYVRLCELSHATADLDNIRQAYNLFASVYALAPDLWLKYLRVERSVAVSDNEVSRVEELFRKALNDYYSVDIAFEFAEFSEQSSNSESIWREVLQTYGCNCMRGQEFFKMYRQHLTNIDTLSSEDKQRAFISSYLQELKYPLNNMEESYFEFQIFYLKNKAQIPYEIDWKQIKKDSLKATSHLKRILPYEKQLESMDVKLYRARSEVYQKYINNRGFHDVEFLSEQLQIILCIYTKS